MESFKINRKFFILKAHYFLFNGGLAGVVAFLPVYARKLGINAISVGIIYTVLPFSVLFAKPILGGIADRFRIWKPMIIALIAVMMVSMLGINFVPDRQLKRNWHQGNDTGNPTTCPDAMHAIICMSCKMEEMDIWKANFTDCDITIHKRLAETVFSNRSLFKELSGDDIKLDLDGPCGSVCCKQNSSVVFKGHDPCPVIVNTYHMSNTSVVDLQSFYYGFPLNEETDLIDREGQRCKIFSQTPDEVFDCEDKVIEKESSLQFALFFIMIVIGWMAFGTAVTLSDAICYHVLGEDRHLYGKQRVWGAIGWGLAGTAVGFLNEVATGDSPTYNYSPGFYLLVVLLTFDITILIINLKVDDLQVSPSIMKDVGKLLAQPRNDVFLLSSFLFGSITGFSRSYYLWYLRTLGASQLILGLCVGTQCLLGELPFFFFSGWIISYAGQVNVFTMSFLAYGLRFLIYSYIQNLWVSIPTEILHGGFAAFYSAMTSYTRVIATPGSEATMHGLVGGIFDGLGVAVGSLLGGLGFGLYSERNTVFWAGIISLIGCSFNMIAHALLGKMSLKDDQKTNSEDVS